MAEITDTSTTNIIRVSTRDRINVKLSTEEIRDRAMLLPKLKDDLDHAETEAKISAKEHKKVIDGAQKALDAGCIIVNSGEEFREVDCERCFNLEKGLTWLEFQGHKYLPRSATDKELELVRQGNLFEDSATPENEDGEEDESAAF